MRFSRAWRRRGPRISAYAVLAKHGVEKLGGSHPIDECQPLRRRSSRLRQRVSVFVPQHLDPGFRVADDRGGEVRRERRHRGVGQPDQTRPQIGGGTQIRRRLREVTENRDGVLNLVGLEEAQTLVDVGLDDAPLERGLELSMAIARAEQDGNVRRPCGPADARRSIANGRAADQAHDLVGHCFGGKAHGAADQQAERGLVDGRLGPASRVVVGDHRKRKPVLFSILERIGRSAVLPRLRLDGVEDVVDEPEQGRDRAEADGDCVPRIALFPQPAHELRRLIEQGDLGVAECVDRLLAIADDEDGRRQRIGSGAESFAPVANELRDEVPLRAAGVLKLVDEHVVVSRLELVPAAREFLHLPQQIERTREHAGKIEQRAGVQRALILRHRDREHPPDAARQHDVQIAPERAHRLHNRRRDARRPPHDAASTPRPSRSPAP